MPHGDILGLCATLVTTAADVDEIIGIVRRSRWMEVATLTIA